MDRRYDSLIFSSCGPNVEHNQKLFCYCVALIKKDQLLFELKKILLRVGRHRADLSGRGDKDITILRTVARVRDQLPDEHSYRKLTLF